MSLNLKVPLSLALNYTVEQAFFFRPRKQSLLSAFVNAIIDLESSGRLGKQNGQSILCYLFNSFAYMTRALYSNKLQSSRVTQTQPVLKITYFSTGQNY